MRLVEVLIQWVHMKSIGKIEMIEEEIAEFIHQKTCTKTHGDFSGACKWINEENDWEAECHGRYLLKAKQFINCVETITGRLLTVEELKKIIDSIF